MLVLSKLDKFYKLFLSSDRKTHQELRRLKRIPRYISDSSNLWGKDKMRFVDACTYLHGGEEIFERKIYEFKADTEKPYIIDCGANIGLSVCYFKNLYPKSEILAYEPDPKIFHVLKDNIENLKFENVKLFQKAIWINNDGVEFNLEGGFSGRIPKSKEEFNIVKVESQSLRDLLTRDVDFLKIDIEGAENTVIFDIEDKLHLVKNIFIEFHSHISEEQKLGEVLNILKKNNFRYSLHEAFVNQKPYVDQRTMLGMDLQMNVYGFKKF